MQSWNCKDSAGSHQPHSRGWHFSGQLPVQSWKMEPIVNVTEIKQSYRQIWRDSKYTSGARVLACCFVTLPAWNKKNAPPKVELFGSLSDFLAGEADSSCTSWISGDSAGSYQPRFPGKYKAKPSNSKMLSNRKFGGCLQLCFTCEFLYNWTLISAIYVGKSQCCPEA